MNSRGLLMAELDPETVARNRMKAIGDGDAIRLTLVRKPPGQSELPS